MKVKISRRTFLKTTLGAVLATGFPIFSLPHALSKPKTSVREFRFSASKARVNLGAGPDFTAWALFQGGECFTSRKLVDPKGHYHHRSHAAG